MLELRSKVVKKDRQLLLAIFILLIIFLPNVSAQSQPKQPVALMAAHEKFKEEGFDKRRFSHEKLEEIILKIAEDARISHRVVGNSIEGRAIHLLSLGEGPVQVFFWSQMHGDESTATRSIPDIFNFLLTDASDEFDGLRKEIFANITLHVLPMLNPDGATLFQRRNLLNVDINRDALRLQSPEARVLKTVRDSLDADFGFNLHDQNTRYTAGKTQSPATISFLAPAYNHEKEINTVREAAMLLIGDLYEGLSAVIPGKIAKYDDEHESRAFGDNIQKWGTSTVLVESGGFPNDPDKQYIRQLNFTLLLAALQSIAMESYQNQKLENYDAIPENDRYLYDLLIRNAKWELKGEKFNVDLGINHHEVNIKESTDYKYRSSVEEFGDMSVFYGYETLDAEGLELASGKIYTAGDLTKDELEEQQIAELLKQGYTHIYIKNFKIDNNEVWDKSINITTDKDKEAGEIGYFKSTDFFLKDGDTYRYAIINGFLIDLQKDSFRIPNARVE